MSIRAVIEELAEVQRAWAARIDRLEELVSRIPVAADLAVDREIVGRLTQAESETCAEMERAVAQAGIVKEAVARECAALGGES